MADRLTQLQEAVNLQVQNQILKLFVSSRVSDPSKYSKKIPTTLCYSKLDFNG
jgi:hypothetical protein